MLAARLDALNAERRQIEEEVRPSWLKPKHAVLTRLWSGLQGKDGIRALWHCGIPS